MMEAYKTIQGTAQARIEEKKSEFIAHAAFADTEEKALAFLNGIRAKHRTANHNVYAYILRDGARMRYSDDGEPAKTSGLPTLEAIRHAGLVDCIVVTTRYFGGTLLGTGGLVRAYSHGASLAVAAGGLQVMRLCDIVRLSCSYGQYGWVAPLIAEQGGVLDDTIFTDTVELAFHLPLEQTEPLQAALTEKSAGALSLAVEERRYFSFESKKTGQNR